MLEIRDISKNFGGTAAVAGVTFDVETKYNTGIIGPNGAGKSTLVNVITGALDGRGEVILDGRDVSNCTLHETAKFGIARTFQIPRPFYDLTIFQNVLIPARQAKSSSNPEQKTEEILQRFGLEERSHMTPTMLNEADLKKLELARSLALDPKYLFLDEVLAGLRENEWRELLQKLEDFIPPGVGIVMIEHIMKAVMEFCDKIIVIVNGKKLTEGSPVEIKNNEEVVKAYLGE